MKDCINRAYRDLCRTLSGIGKYEQKAEWKTKIAGIIETAIGNLNSKDNLDQAKFDCWHNKTCSNIKNESVIMLKDNKITFEYGHAQKWLNMTLKYQMMFDKDFEPEIREFMHVPVDSFIIEAAKASGVHVPCKEAWSKWTKDNYTTFQQNLREKLTGNLMEWEEKVWIEVAKKRAEAEQKSKTRRNEKTEKALGK